MKRFLKEVVFLTFTAIGVPLMVSGAEPVNAATLRYHFALDTTNAYQLRIETQGESGREAIEGVYLISTKSVTNNVATLIFRGQLHPKPIPGQPPMMMGYRGPGSPMTLSAYAMRPQMEGMEMVVDGQGNVLRESGDVALPVPLGQVMSSLFVPVPDAATNAWSLSEDVSVTDEPTAQGPASMFFNSPYGMNYGYPGRPGLGVLPAMMKTSVHVTEAGGESFTLHRTFTLESSMRTGADPRVGGSGEGNIVFNQKLGLPESVELQCKSTVATENISRRSTATLRWKLLEGEERDAALNPPPPPPNPGEVEMSNADLTGLTDKLKSDDLYQRQDAVRRLASAKISAPAPELMSRMVELVNDPDDNIDNSALIFVANHATEENVMLLIKSLNTSDQNARTAIVRALGKAADKRAAEPLADMLARGQTEQLQYSNGSRYSDVADALIRIGPAAEGPVLGLLKERNNATRWQACVILKRIGTGKSLAALKEASLSSSKDLSEAASDAYRTIEAREK